MTFHLCRFFFAFVCAFLWQWENFHFKTHPSLKLPKILLWKFWPFKWFDFEDVDMGPPTSIGESDLLGVGLIVEFWSLDEGKENSKITQIIKKFQSYLDPGEEVPSLLPEHDWWLMLFESGRSVSESILGLEGGTLELLPSSSSKSPSPVTFGEHESLLFPSC